MVNSIDQALVTQFTDMLHIEASQRKTRLRGKVLEKPVSGNDASYERLDDRGMANEITGRHQATSADEIAHTRRQIKMRDFEKTFYLDKFDDLQVLINPQSEYAKVAVRNMFRRYDALVIDAALGSVNEGRNFGTTTTAAADGVTTIAAGGTGLTFAKLLTVSENFENNEVGIDDDEKILLLISGQQHRNMREELELSSSDFAQNSVLNAQTGVIESVLGMEVIIFGTNKTNLLNKTGAARDCIAMSSRAVQVGVNQDIAVDIDRRPDLNNLKQVQTRMFLGATRTEGVLVQKVQCTEV